MVRIRIGAGVGRSSFGFWLFASISVECKTVLGMGWGLIPTGPGLERGCFHRQQILPLAVKGLTREIKRYIYHSLTDAQLTRLGSVELNLN